MTPKAPKGLGTAYHASATMIMAMLMDRNARDMDLKAGSTPLERDNIVLYETGNKPLQEGWSV